MKRNCVFWNVQRLFDPEGLPVARELGSSTSEWDLSTYARKIDNLAACLRFALGEQAPLLIGLCEVESVRVQHDLLKALGWPQLASVDDVVPAPHLDGLDVCLLFDRESFEVLGADSIGLDNQFATRDLLQVRLHNEDWGPFDVFVGHWPSRLITEGTFLRVSYSLHLRRRIEHRLRFRKHELLEPSGKINMPAPETLAQRWQWPCLVMGDFNDEPFDTSIREALRAARTQSFVQKYATLSGLELEEADNYLASKWFLYNPCWQLPFAPVEPGTGPAGTFYREAQWRTYDQVMVTHGMLSSKARIQFDSASPRVLRLKDTLDLEGQKVNMTTANGLPRKFSKKVPEGVSDHLPLLFDLEIP